LVVLFVGISKCQEQYAVFMSPTILLQSGAQWDDYFVSVQRPSGRIGISSVRFTPIDVLTQQTIPIENVYNHHIYLAEYSPSLNRSMTIAAIGAEGAHTPVMLPTPYVVTVETDDIWILGTHLISLWGIPAGANQTISLQYEVTYYSLPSSGTGQYLPVLYQLLTVVDTGNDTYNVPGGGPLGSVYVKAANYQFSQTQTLVYAWGHIHIGSVNVSLVNTYTQEIIAYSYPTYDEYGFVVALNRQYPMVQVSPNQQFTLISVYDNSRAYQQVMGMMQVYWSVSTNNDDPIVLKYTNNGKRFHLFDHVTKPNAPLKSYVN